VSALITAAALAIAPNTAASAEVGLNSNPIPGIDISSHQHPGEKNETLNWKSVGSDGQKFALIKATESDSYENPHWKYDAEQAKANGMKVGLYHFARVKQSAKSQADFFAKAVKTLGECRPPCDLLLRDARELGDVLFHHPVLGTDIALELVLLFKVLIQAHRTDLDDLSVELSSDLPVFFCDGVHLKVYDDVFHEQSLLSKKSAVSDARQTVLQCSMALPSRRAFTT